MRRAWPQHPDTTRRPPADPFITRAQRTSQGVTNGDASCSLPPGITRDLEAIVSAGIKGVHLFEVSDRMPAGPVVKTPALSMQQLVWSETFDSGGKAVHVQLSRW
ncbi:hypothetical protein GCM10022207_89190 [Streptomyces lannensis]|uniref:Uncharacterized protein n=1 Tax=Streptomyces lannensis TaxID=766498 RepID=A0ABP7LRC8_9ACTN